MRTSKLAESMVLTAVPVALFMLIALAAAGEASAEAAPSTPSVVNTVGGVTAASSSSRGDGFSFHIDADDDFSFHLDPDEPDGDGVDDTETASPHIDVLFLLDSTGSMGDEIEVVKDKIEEIIFEVENGTPKPDVRYAIVTYRDRGDAYITKLFDFTENVDNIKTFLRSIQARNGGDGPESVNEALHVAINDCSWGNDHVKMIFLIGDAPPHMDYENDYDYRNEVEVAKERGIKIYVIGCSGITSYWNGESIFKEIAEKTDGTYEKLIYTSEGDSYSSYDGSTYVVDYTSYSITSCSRWTMPDRVGGYAENVGEYVETGWGGDFELSSYCAPPTASTCSVSAGSSVRERGSKCYSNILDIQLTYAIQQVAIQNGVSYENAVSVPTQ